MIIILPVGRVFIESTGRDGMTSQQKEAVLQLRNKGLGYTEIARQLGLSVNTLKSFGRRNDAPRLDRALSDEGERVDGCKQCGSALIQTPKHRRKLFCSDRCRYAWWTQNRLLSRSSTPRVCPNCEKHYVARKSQKHCSHSCYIAARFGGQQYENTPHGAHAI